MPSVSVTLKNKEIKILQSDLKFCVIYILPNLSFRINYWCLFVKKPGYYSFKIRNEKWKFELKGILFLS